MQTQQWSVAVSQPVGFRGQVLFCLAEIRTVPTCQAPHPATRQTDDALVTVPGISASGPDTVLRNLRLSVPPEPSTAA